MALQESSVEIACLDLEGFWSRKSGSPFAEKTGIAELKATTTGYSDYDVLMRSAADSG